MEIACVCVALICMWRRHICVGLGWLTVIISVIASTAFSIYGRLSRRRLLNGGGHSVPLMFAACKKQIRHSADSSCMMHAHDVDKCERVSFSIFVWFYALMGIRISRRSRWLTQRVTHTYICGVKRRRWCRWIDLIRPRITSQEQNLGRGQQLFNHSRSEIMNAPMMMYRIWRPKKSSSKSCEGNLKN